MKVISVPDQPEELPQEVITDALTQDRVIAAALIEDIVEWRIPPGSWIREREIAKRFEVSHAPVREAFRQIANIGLVEVVPWRGARVAVIDKQATIEILELWKSLFGVVCRLASQRMTDSEAEQLVARVKEFTAIAHATRNTFDHLAVSNRIGAYIAHCARAPQSKTLLDRVAIVAKWQQRIISQKFLEDLPVAPALKSAEIYERLCAAIKARQPDKADELARALIGNLQDYYQEALATYLDAQAVEQALRKPPRRK